MPEIEDIRLKVLNRLYNQCKQLGLTFNYDYNYLKENLDNVDVEKLTKEVDRNLEEYKRRRRTGNRFQKIKPDKKRNKQKHLNTINEPRKKKKKKKMQKSIGGISEQKSKKKTTQWFRIIYTNMWRG